MKQLVTRATQGVRPVSPNINISALNSTTDSILIKEVETTVTTRERTYLTIAPVCGACGETKTRIIGMLFECVNQSCPTHDPDTGSAIPLPGEGEEIIDVEPVAKRRAA